MEKYAQVIIDISRRGLDRTFTYRIPQALQEKVRAGSIVMVPFGAGSTLRKGYVTGFSDHAGIAADRIKEIAEVLEPTRGYSMEDDSEYYLRLAAWMKNRYGATMAAAMRTVLASRKQGKILEHRQIRLLLSEEDAKEKLAEFDKKHQKARARLLKELLEVPLLPWTLVTARLHVSSSVIQAMKRMGIIEVESVQELRNPVNVSASTRTGMKLSEAQQRIVDRVIADFDALQEREAVTPRVSLIHGVTGSGKTEVYISIIRQICARGRQAIMLIPEIALTFQTLMRFYSHFGDRVSVVNSSLSDAERTDQWERARRGEIDVIIGPRSALFTPFSNPGVIVIDEEHEHSYKNESMPKYQTREVAEEIARMHGAVLVLGSATPSLESYWRAQQGEIRLFRLQERLTGGTLPSVETVDMRQELQHGNRSILSRSLYEKIRARLSAGQQSMLVTGADMPALSPAGSAALFPSVRTATSLCRSMETADWSAITAAMSGRPSGPAPSAAPATSWPCAREPSRSRVSCSRPFRRPAFSAWTRIRPGRKEATRRSCPLSPPRRQISFWGPR